MTTKQTRYFYDNYGGNEPVANEFRKSLGEDPMVELRKVADRKGADADRQKRHADSTAVKDDNLKPKISMIPYPALIEEAKAMAHGAAKYSKHNYMHGQGLSYSRLIDAALRHIHKFAAGTDIDQESGEDYLHHLGCARAALGMLLHLISENHGVDDRLDYVTKVTW